MISNSSSFFTLQKTGNILYLAIVAILSTSFAAFATEDNLQKSMEIAVQGTSFQAQRMTIAAENLANESSTSMQPGGEPYRRKVIFAKNTYDRKLGARTVQVAKYDTSQTPFERKYDPNHPAADLNGYVLLPNVNRDIERADASEAQRSYEANLGVIEVSRSMIQKTIDAIK
ncbi:MAG: flagellar basal body rod protein FlgC [Pseudomonadota bacterium]